MIHIFNIDIVCSCVAQVLDEKANNEVTSATHEATGFVSKPIADEPVPRLKSLSCGRSSALGTLESTFEVHDVIENSGRLKAPIRSEGLCLRVQARMTWASPIRGLNLRLISYLFFRHRSRV